MQVACRCGQPFTIKDARFPHRVSCHVCGQRFLVFDDGSTRESADQPENIAVEQERPVTFPPIAETAILADSVAKFDSPSAHATDRSSAIVADSTVLAGSGSTDADRLRCEVDAIDTLWNIERQGHSLLPFFQTEVLPTKGLVLVLACAIALAALPAWLYLDAVDVPAMARLCFVGLPTIIASYFPLYVFKLSLDFKRAETAWQNRRFAALKRFHSGR